VSSTPISPKVTSGGVWAGYATLILALLNTVTPDSLTFLGHLAPLGYGVVIGGSYALGAWLKTDPLRAAKPGPDGSFNITSLPPASAPVSFAPTQARLDAAAAAEVEPVTVTPVYEPPPAPEAPPAP
jgi:hypothetical protein